MSGLGKQDVYMSARGQTYFVFVLAGSRVKACKQLHSPSSEGMLYRNHGIGRILGLLSDQNDAWKISN